MDELANTHLITKDLCIGLMREVWRENESKIKLLQAHVKSQIELFELMFQYRLKAEGKCSHVTKTRTRMIGNKVAQKTALQQKVTSGQHETRANCQGCTNNWYRTW